MTNSDRVMASPADTGLALIGIMLVVPQYTLVHPYLHLLIMAPLCVFTGCHRAHTIECLP